MKRQTRSVVLPIVIINIVMFILQIVLDSPNNPWFTESFMLIGNEVLSRPWMLITHMFLHGSFAHILFNMYALFIFGPILEQRIGPKRFLLTYFVSGLVAAIVSIFLYPLIFGYSINALGASGAIMGMLGVMIILNPGLRLLFFFIFPMSLRTAGIIWILMDLFGVFYTTGVGNIAHLAGMFTGLIMGKMFTKKKKKFDKKFESKSHLSEDDISEYLKSGRV